MMQAAHRPPPTTILVIFREQSVANWIGDCIREAGYVAAVANGYDDALRTLGTIEPDAAIVAASKMERDIEEFLAWLESDRRGRDIPTVFVAPTRSQGALVDIASHSRSRRAYLSWPLKCSDLQLIMQDLLRTDRQGMEPVASTQLILDPRLRLLRGRAGTTVLTPVECRLAEYLMSQGGRPTVMADLLTQVFGLYQNDGNPALVRWHVASLRQKIRITTGGSDLIRAVGRRGFVYLGS
jgi:DNA-binding response OmpR family regulator